MASDKEKKILSLLGLAARGRNLTGGENQVLDAIRTGTARLVIIAENASDNTKKKFTDKCEFYDIPIRIWGTGEDLGHGTGHEYRVSLALTENGFAEKIIALMDE